MKSWFDLYSSFVACLFELAAAIAGITRISFGELFQLDRALVDSILAKGSGILPGVSVRSGPWYRFGISLDYPPSCDLPGHRRGLASRGRWLPAQASWQSCASSSPPCPDWLGRQSASKVTTGVGFPLRYTRAASVGWPLVLRLPGLFSGPRLLVHPRDLSLPINDCSNVLTSSTEFCRHTGDFSYGQSKTLSKHLSPWWSSASTRSPESK